MTVPTTNPTLDKCGLVVGTFAGGGASPAISIHYAQDRPLPPGHLARTSPAQMPVFYSECVSGYPNPRSHETAGLPPKIQVSRLPNSSVIVEANAPIAVRLAPEILSDERSDRPVDGE